MSVRTTILAALDYIRTTVPGPTVMDVRPTSVQVVQRLWAGGRIGLSAGGPPTDTVVAQLPPTKVLHVSEREVAGSGGRFKSGDVRVGPITPTYPAVGPLPAGGFTELQLAPIVTTQGVELLYKLTLQAGASGIAGEYALVTLERDKSLHFNLVLRARATTPHVAAAPVLP